MGTVPSTNYCWAPGSCPSVKILSKSVTHGSLGAVCEWGIGVTCSDLHVFNVYRHKRALYWVTHSILGLVALIFGSCSFLLLICLNVVWIGLVAFILILTTHIHLVPERSSKWHFLQLYSRFKTYSLSSFQRWKKFGTKRFIWHRENQSTRLPASLAPSTIAPWWRFD